MQIYINTCVVIIVAEIITVFFASQKYNNMYVQAKRRRARETCCLTVGRAALRTFVPSCMHSTMSHTIYDAMGIFWRMDEVVVEVNGVDGKMSLRVCAMMYCHQFLGECGWPSTLMTLQSKWCHVCGEQFRFYCCFTVCTGNGIRFVIFLFTDFTWTVLTLTIN